MQEPYLPEEVTRVEMAFPASVRRLMPDPETIPEIPHRWVEFQRAWFFGGLEDLKLKPAPGIDLDAALRHLHCIQGSYEPKHEHKEAAVAYLASIWFTEKSSWKRKKRVSK